MPGYVTVNAPDDVNGTHEPIFDGDARDAHFVIVPGVYAATEYTYADYADYVQSGYVIVYGPDESRAWKSAGLTPGASGSFFVPETCNMMGCPTREPHDHTIAEITGEWWI